MASLKKAMKRAHSKKKPLSKLSVDEIMAGEGDSSEDEKGNEDMDECKPTSGKKKTPSSTSKPRNSMARLAETDPEFYQYLAKNDQQLLEFSGDEESDDGAPCDDDPEEGDMGRPEPVPPSVTSRSEKPCSSESDEEEGEEVPMQEGGAQCSGKAVTLQMVNKWVAKVTKTHSLSAWKMLVQALQAAICTIGDQQDDKSVPSTLAYRVEGTNEFNAIVGGCLKHTYECLSHHIEIAHRPGKRPSLPSTHRAWPMVKKTLKIYLPTITRLLQGLHESSMQRAILRHIHMLAPYFACFPKTERSLKTTLVTLWSSGEEHVQVLAFLTIRALTLLHPHPALHLTLKKLYMSFVRNCKFTLPSTQPRIRFMQNCLVELLSIDPPTAYQHAFVYIRQLAVHLRSAYASHRKDSQQAVYNWQYVHCLDLWAMLLGQRKEEETLKPLLYPLIQTAIGTITLQPSPKYYPLRLHCVRTLLELSEATGTFVPLAPYLLEIMEAQASAKTSPASTGKPPDLANLLRLSKAQLQSRALQSNLLNESFETMVQLLANHSCYIGFPEFAFPVIVRLKKVAKATSLSWFRMQLKQLIEKAEDVSREIARDRAAVSFSPKDSDQIGAWEKNRKSAENCLVRFLNTWRKVHRQEHEGQEPAVAPHVAKKQAVRKVHEEASDGEDSVEGEEGGEREDDEEEREDDEEEKGEDSGDEEEEEQEGGPREGDSSEEEGDHKRLAKESRECRLNVDSEGEEEDVVEDLQFSSDDDAEGAASSEMES